MAKLHQLKKLFVESDISTIDNNSTDASVLGKHGLLNCRGTGKLVLNYIMF